MPAGSSARTTSDRLMMIEWNKITESHIISHLVVTPPSYSLPFLIFSTGAKGQVTGNISY